MIFYKVPIYDFNEGLLHCFPISISGSFSLSRKAISNASKMREISA